MDEIILRAARELGIEQYVSVSPYSSHGEGRVTVAYAPGKGVTRELDFFCVMDEAELKRILLQMFEEAKELAAGVSAD